MSRHYRITMEPLWKLAGFGLLLLSFVFTGWILGNATVAVDHLLAVLAGFFQNTAAILQPHDHTLFVH